MEIRNYAPLLYSLSRCRGNCERNILLSHLDDKTFGFMCNQIGNSIENPEILNLPPARLKKLRTALMHDRKKIKYITRKGGVIERKRKVVRQSGEGLGLLVGILAPVLINLVKKLVKGKRK